MSKSVKIVQSTQTLKRLIEIIEVFLWFYSKNKTFLISASIYKISLMNQVQTLMSQFSLYVAILFIQSTLVISNSKGLI